MQLPPVICENNTLEYFTIFYNSVLLLWRQEIDQMKGVRSNNFDGLTEGMIESITSCVYNGIYITFYTAQFNKQRIITSIREWESTEAKINVQMYQESCLEIILVSENFGEVRTVWRIKKNANNCIN